MDSAMEKLKASMYYILIGVISFVALAFLPAVGSNIGFGLALPSGAAGWIVWITTKLIVAVINVLIFHCFRLQGKLNVSKDERFLRAQDLLRKANRAKKIIPMSPAQWNRKQWSSKGITIFVTSALSTFALTQAILTFDWISMLTYLFTILMGLIFGILQMKKEEEYWTDGYLGYAEYVTAEEPALQTSEPEPISYTVEENLLPIFNYQILEET